MDKNQKKVNCVYTRVNSVNYDRRPLACWLLEDITSTVCCCGGLTYDVSMDKINIQGDFFNYHPPPSKEP